MSRQDPADRLGCARCGRSLSPADWPVLARAVVLLAAVSVAIRTRSFGAVHRWAHGARATAPGRCPACLSRVVNVAATWLGGRPTCLARALVLTRLLRQNGREARVVIGVSRRGGFAAHAWVEHGGRAIGDEALTRAQFVALARKGTRGAEGRI